MTRTVALSLLIVMYAIFFLCHTVYHRRAVQVHGERFSVVLLFLMLLHVS